MPNISFQEIIKLESRYGIVLCRSVSKTGEPFFHYIMAKKQQIEQMHRDYAARKDIDFFAYGEVVHSGWGKNPSAEDEHIIKQKFPL